MFHVYKKNFCKKFGLLRLIFIYFDATNMFREKKIKNSEKPLF